MTFRQACQLLVVDPKYATWRQVRGLYRELARTTHPDAGGDRRDWDLLQEAYAALRLAFNVPQTCPTCQGAKVILVKFNAYKCPTCDGKGELPPQTIGPPS